MTESDEIPLKTDAAHLSGRTDARTALKDAVLEIRRLRSELAAQRRSRTEPVAVVAMACRFPGGAVDPESYWQLLRDGECAVRPVSPDRWDGDAWLDDRADAAGKLYTHHGGYLDTVDTFDPDVFGISPREAKGLDPQQRLLLEVSWEALERACLPASKLRGSDTGVYIGMSTDDYAHLTSHAYESIDAWNGLGSMRSVAAGRIAYTFGLEGPALLFDTSCSSSLAAVHQACRDLQSGTVSAAIAGGVNLILTPRTTITLCRLKALSPDGVCRTFDADANGYVRGEGCGVVVLKTLKQAQKDGDSILAVVRSSAMNHDGQSNGLTAPNGQVQERLMRRALAEADLRPDQVQYVEAHGTGTRLGDPIEVHALGSVYGPGHTQEHPLRIGSVKPNIGHLEAAAGIAGFIKTVLSLEHGEIVPHLHFKNPNPHIAWERLPVSVPVKSEAWETAGEKRRAAVSAFGMSGTNVHVVLEEYGDGSTVTATGRQRLWNLLTLSAWSNAALDALVERYQELLRSPSPPSLPDLCYSANTGRTVLDRRAAFTAASHSGLATALNAYATRRNATEGGTADGHFICSPSEGTTAPRIGFLFTGQGSQYPRMGRELYGSEPVFTETLDRCNEVLEPILGRSLRALIDDEPDLLNRTQYTQPALFSLECALYKLWESWGVFPRAVMGHSLGEYAAAWAAGVFDLEQGLVLIAERARLMQSMPGGGAMVAVLGPEEQVRNILPRFQGTIEIAALNGPDHVVLTGSDTAVRQAIDVLEGEGLTCRALDVSHAFHSKQMDGMLADFEALAAGVEFREPSLPMISNLMGRPIAPGEMGAGYWSAHTRQTVRFQDGVLALAKAGCSIFVEIGPGPVLLGMASRILTDPGIARVPSLRRGVSDSKQLLLSAGELFVRGVPIDFEAVDRGVATGRCLLPTYPFQRRRFWLDAAPQTQTPAVTGAVTERRRSEERPIEESMYTLDWVPLRQRDRVNTSRFPSTDELGNRLLPRLHALSREKEIGRIRELQDSLDPIGLRFVLDAWRECHLPTSVGDRFHTGEAAAGAGIAPERLPVFARMIDILEGEDLLSAHGEEIEITRDFPGLLQEVTDEYPGAPSGVEAEAALLRRCGSSLGDVLQGRVNPLELLFPGGDTTLAERLYESSAESTVVNDTASRAIAAIANSVDTGRVRILEIGAGTGGTTSHVLPALSDVACDYVYSDVSPALIERARQKFAEYPFIDYRILDIETAPQDQGFRHTFDIVVASNVLHATADLRSSLAHVRQLLSPGGVLILIEVTGRARWLDLTFGLTDGWWKFRDRDLRSWGPLLTAPAWESLLAEGGLEGTSALTAAGSGTGHQFQQSVIISRKASDVRAESEGTWLLFVDKSQHGLDLCRAWEQQGYDCVQVHVGTRFVKHSDWEFQVDPMDPEGFDLLLREMSERQPQGILHTWNIGTTPIGLCEVEDLKDACRVGCASVLHLVQSLLTHGTTALPVWIVTSGAQNLSDDGSAEPAQSIVLGLGKVLGQEHPELNLRFLDIAPSDIGGELSTVPALVLDEGHCAEAEIALRGAEVWAPRLRRLVSGPKRPLPVVEDATYLVTGGLGGVGLEAAQWLIERGASSLILMARSAPGVEAAERIKSWRRQGACVEVFQGDVSRAEDVSRLVAFIRLNMKPLRGLIQSAGIYDDRLVDNHRWELFEKVFEAKVAGTWNLHRSTVADELDFFVSFSSITSLVGSAGLANYAAANAFLDAFSAFRRCQGLPALTVCWGPWDDIGMARKVGARGQAQWQASGVQPLGSGANGRALEIAMGSDVARVGVLDVDWNRFMERFVDDGRALQLRHLCENSGELQAAEAPLTELRQTEESGRLEVLVRQIRSVVAAVLEYDDAEQLPLDRGLFQLGMDSLMALDLVHRINREYGCALSGTAIFRHPTVTELAQRVLNEIQEDRLSTGSAPSQGVEQGAAFQDATPAPSKVDHGKGHEKDRGNDGVAIVGMACRYPGGSDTPEAFWRLLSHGVDAVIPYPQARWDIEALFDPDPERAGTIAARQGGFLNNIDQFDPAFFGISPREATSLDPQQRLLLEVSWEVLERAGIPPSSLRESSTGVFVGIGQSDYAQWQLNAGDLEAISAYDGTGTGVCFAAGRISHTLGLNGPSLVVDTACSSSLVSVHLACQSLLNGECSAALAGGAHLNLSPEVSVFLSRTGALAPDGRCKAFDASADGFGRGEGIGMVFLKRLADARADGDPVLAVIRGSAINHDGPSSGLTVPSQKAQESLLREALRRADVRPEDVAFVEAHGTGTVLGDPIEVESLGRVYGEGRSQDRPLYIGSVKSNIGHLEAAAGIAGLMKSVLALQHGTIPRQLHFTTPNPHVDWEDIPIRVAGEGAAWKDDDKRRIAGISSLGMSGTNAHVLLEASPPRPDPVPMPDSEVLLVLSAKTEPALEDLAERCAAVLGQDSAPDPIDFCAAAALGRDHHARRLAVLGTSAIDLCGKLLNAFAASPERDVFHCDAPGVPGDETGSDALRTLARDYVDGADIDWRSAMGLQPRRPDLLPTYPFQRQRYWVDGSPFSRAGERPTDRLYHALQWEPADLATPEQPEGVPASWIIFADRAGFGDRAAETIRESGLHVSCFYEDDGTPVEDLLSVSLGETQGPVEVVYLWSLERTASSGGPAQDAIKQSETVLRIARHLHSQQGSGTRLWIGTLGAQAIREQERIAGLSSAPLWGLGRSLALECPDAWGGLVDFDPAAGPAEGAARLLEWINRRSSESQVAFRDGAAFVPRIISLPVLPEAEIDIRADATYLVSGGLGALGMRTARWLVDKGAENLVLFGRRGPNEASGKAVADLAEKGVRILALPADVTDRDAMQALFRRIEAELPPLRGIVHAAGLPGVSPLEEITADALRSVMAPKVAGAQNLDDMACGLDLDFFIVYASIASVWGSRHQAHYAAANGFLEALAADRRARCVPATCVSWGPWDGEGMVTKDDGLALNRMGIEPMSDAQFAGALDRVIGSRRDLIVADVDWLRLRELFETVGAASPFSKMGDAKASVTAGRSPESDRFLRQWTSAAESERPSLLRILVGVEIAEVLGLPEEGALDPDQGFFELGMDSMMAVGLRKRLSEVLQIKLPSTLVFDHPTINSLTNLLSGLLAEEAPGLPGSADGEVSQPARPTSDGSSRAPEPGDADPTDETMRRRLERLEALLKEV